LYSHTTGIKTIKVINNNLPLPYNSHLIVAMEFVSSENINVYADSNVASGRISLGEQAERCVPDEEEYLTSG
jgi:hypothetical protein